MDWAAIGLSLRLAVSTTLILCCVGLPLSYWLAVTKWRWKFLIEAVVALPLVLPPTVLGFYILTALARLDLAFSFGGLLIASILFCLPFAVRPFIAGFAGVDRRLVEASWCLGVSRWATFFRVVVPLSWTGILSGLVLTFAHTVGEFGVVLMVGGNRPGVTRTVSISIYDDVQSLNYAAAGQTALLLLGFSFAALTVVYALQRRVWVL